MPARRQAAAASAHRRPGARRGGQAHTRARRAAPRTSLLGEMVYTTSRIFMATLPMATAGAQPVLSKRVGAVARATPSGARAGRARRLKGGGRRIRRQRPRRGGARVGGSGARAHAAAAAHLSRRVARRPPRPHTKKVSRGKKKKRCGKEGRRGCPAVDPNPPLSRSDSIRVSAGRSGETMGTRPRAARWPAPHTVSYSSAGNTCAPWPSGARWNDFCPGVHPPGEAYDFFFFGDLCQFVQTVVVHDCLCPQVSVCAPLLRVLIQGPFVAARV